MSRKRTANTGWESDEEDLLMNDGGISAFKNEDDEIDEEALLGLGDDDGTDANYLQAHDSGVGEQGGFEDQQDELLEIGVDEEEIEELVVGDDHFEVNKNDGLEEESEQLDYNDDLPQTDDVHVEYDNEVADFDTAERDVIQEEPQEASHTESSLSYAQDESDNQNISTVEATGDSESESEDSDGEKHRRGRFKSERSSMISVSKVKSRTDIPDTLEVSAEQQAQLDQFPDNRNRGRGRHNNNNNRGRGWGQQRGGFRGGRQDHGDNRQGVGPMRTNRGRQHPFASPFPHHQMRPHGLPTPLMGRDAGRMPHPGDRSLGHQFMGRPSAGPMGPQPLMRLQQGNRLQQGQGNRQLVLNQEGVFKFNMGAPQQGGMATLVPGQLPPGHPLQQRPQAPPQHSQLRPGLPMSASPPRPHNIHINPNFRGPTPGGPPASSATPLGQPAFAQPNMTQVFRAPAAMDGPRPLPGQPQRFGQPQGFQHGPHMGAPPHQPGLNMRAGQPQQSRFASPSSHGMGQPRLMGSPRHPNSSAAGFPGQRLPPHHSQNQPQFPAHFNNNNNNQPPQSQSMQHHNRSASPRFSTPQQGIFSRPSPPQQQQQRPGLFTAHAQRRMGAQPQGTTPVKVNAITTAKKLSQQARMTQQARAATQSVSKNITVVSLKRRSTDNSGSGEPPKVARTTEPSVASELCDEELQQGLEEQKRLREMIKKRKEEARRRQAELRRRELEARLAKQGLTIEDVERVGTKPSAETQPEHNPAAEDADSVQQGAQRIMTVVSRGGKKQLTTPAKRQQQQQQQPVTAQHPVQPQLASQPPQQFASQHYQQQSAVFSSVPPQQQQQQQHLHNPGVFNNPGFAQQQQQQQFQPPQQPFQPVRQQQQLPQQMSPTPLGQSPFKSQPFQQTQQPPPAAPQQFQSPPPGGQFAQAAHGQFPPQQFEFQQPQQQRFLPHETGDTPGTAQHGRQQFQNRQAILGAVVGRGAARGMASGQVASVRGQGPTGRGQGAGGRGQVVRGRGQVGRGGGQLSRGRGMSAGVAASPQRAMSASSGPQASSNRVVIPVGGGRGIPQGAASAPPSGRVVVQRQVVPRSASTKSKMVTSGAMQKVSIDNLAKGTQEFEIRQHCESVGPVSDIVMIESQQKAIVTFGSKAHAVQFAKQWNRRMVNLSLVSVTLLP